MGVFSRWRDGRDFDLARLGVPRLFHGGAVVVEELAPMSPFLLEHEGRPTVLVRLDECPEAVVKAVEDGHCLLAAGWKLYSTYPLLIFSLFIYESPDRAPLTVEGYRRVTSGDVQDFVVSLGRSRGQGRVLLYSGDPPDLVGDGRFALRIPPFFSPPDLPYQTSRENLQILWLMFKIVARQHARIPEDQRDFAAAVKTHMKREPTMSSRSQFDSTGVKS